MTILEATRTSDNAFAARCKAFVLKSSAGYRSEQGSDYEARGERRNRRLEIDLARNDNVVAREANPGARARAS